MREIIYHHRIDGPGRNAGRKEWSVGLMELGERIAEKHGRTTVERVVPWQAVALAKAAQRVAKTNAAMPPNLQGARYRSLSFCARSGRLV